MFVVRWQMTRLSWEISGKIKASNPARTGGYERVPGSAARIQLNGE
jgi:hypothetical protein